MDKNLKIFLIAIAALIILTPIGLIATGTAYGEWDGDYLRQTLGYIPSGFSSLSGLWNAPLADYGIPGQGDTFIAMTPGYIISAIVGVCLAGGALYLIGKVAIKNKD